MKFYLVGGAVRDRLLGVEPKDLDFVVVNPEQSFFSGWELVGKDFPVYLDPVHGYEVAFARTERKVGNGYSGFECETNNVTLEEDLLRRDLTINAIAIEVDYEATCSTGEIVTIGDYIDPYGGIDDLTVGYLTPVSEAFCEDPLRVLRAARFLARYKNFLPSLKLIEYCHKLEKSGELEHLVAERVWSETEKALSEVDPTQYFRFLVNFDFSFVNMFREMLLTKENNQYHQEDNVFEHTMMVLNEANNRYKDPMINFGALLHDFGKPECYHTQGNAHGHNETGLSHIKEFCDKWRVPSDYWHIAHMTCKIHQRVHSIFGRDSNSRTKPKSIMKMFDSVNALNRVDMFKKSLKVCEADNFGRISINISEYNQRSFLEECLDAVVNMSTKEISLDMLKKGKSGPAIGEAIRVARIDEIRKVQKKWSNNEN